MNVNELKRNGSGYYDPTAYKALKNIESEENGMEIKVGDIWEVEAGIDTKLAVVIATHHAHSSILLLQDDVKPQRDIDIFVQGNKQAESSMVSYKFNTAFREFVRKTTAEEFEDIMQKVANSLCLYTSPHATHYAREIEDLKKELVRAVEAIQVLEREKADWAGQPITFREDTDEIVRLKAQIEVLERQNEKLLDRLIG